MLRLVKAELLLLKSLRAVEVEDADDVYNKKYSGLYLIRDCMHFFSPVANNTTSYKVDMNIVKDGWNA